MDAQQQKKKTQRPRKSQRKQQQQQKPQEEEQPQQKGYSPKLDREQVTKAVTALVKFEAESNKKKADPSRPLQLIEEEQYLYVTAMLHVLPTKSTSDKPHAIPVSHPVLSPSDDICLIVSTRHKEVRDRLRATAEGSSLIKKVLDIKKIKQMYKSFESRRKLVAGYGLFLCEARVALLMPSLLGKAFFEKKKLPIPIGAAYDPKKTGSETDLIKAINKALNCTFLSVNMGHQLTVRAARFDPDMVEEMVDNVLDVTKGFAKHAPGKGLNLRMIAVKTTRSPILPVFCSLPPTQHIEANRPVLEPAVDWNSWEEEFSEFEDSDAEDWEVGEEDDKDADDLQNTPEAADAEDK